VVLAHSRSGRKVGFRFHCDGWDESPPSLELFDPESGVVFEWSTWPHDGWNAGDQHPVTKRPFLCLPGIREYHTHSSHLDDIWEPRRNVESYGLLAIVDRVQQKFNMTTN
jgi:hypothetical protein